MTWHPKAKEERQAIDDARERVAIKHVTDKLKVDGPVLRAPHQSAVKGKDGRGLRELRPRGGRSRWRPIYRRIDDRAFRIFAVAPDAEIDAPGYRRKVRIAKQRLDEEDTNE